VAQHDPREGTQEADTGIENPALRAIYRFCISQRWIWSGAHKLFPSCIGAAKRRLV